MRETTFFSCEKKIEGSKINDARKFKGINVLKFGKILTHFSSRRMMNQFYLT